MAEAIQNTCNACGHQVEAWSDGNPYFIDADGEKQYAYHPDEERLALCHGNDSPHLCLGCGADVMVDSEAPVDRCSKCGAGELVDTFHLEGKRCPFCKEGTFVQEPDFFCISYSAPTKIVSSGARKPVSRQEFKGLVAKVMREEFNIGLRHDVPGEDGSGQRHGCSVCVSTLRLLVGRVDHLKG